MCHCSNLYHVYNNNYNNNYSFVILICLQHFCKHKSFANTLSPTNVLEEKVRIRAFSRTLSRPLMYVHSHTCLFGMPIVVGLFGWCSMYLCIAYYCVCFFYLFHTHDLCFCSFCLLFSCDMMLGLFDFYNNIYKIG